VGSFVASISQNVAMMIAGEAIIEGFGAALMMPATMSLIVSNYKGRDRQIGFGVWGAIAGAAGALGPVVGGWLTTYASWRWAFRINVFVAMFLVIGSFFIAEARDTEEKASLDIKGVILSAVGLLLVVFGFIESSTYGWWHAKQAFVINIGEYFLEMNGPYSIVPFIIAIGVLILILFAAWEDHIVRLGRTPLVSLNLFKNTQFTLAVIIVSILALGQSGLAFAIPVFLQAVKHLNALDTGVAMLPMTLTLLIAAPSSAFLTKYVTPKRIIQIGLVSNILAFFVIRASIQTDATQWSLAPGLILFGAGMGFMMSQLSNLAISAVSVQEAGEVSGVNGTFRTVGQTLGSAIIGAVLISVLSSNLVNGVNSSSVIPQAQKSIISQAVSQQTSNIEFGSGSSAVGKNLPPILGKEIVRISQAATVKATHTTLLIGAGFLILALLLSTKLPKYKNIEVEKSIAVGH
jgi:MFS family permease